MTYSWPMTFRVITVKETVEYERKKTFQTVTKELFVSHALEWSLVTQGETLESALDSMDRILLCQHAIHLDFPNSVPTGPAPECMQRLRESGDLYVPTSPWLLRIYPDGLPVVDRRDIDMSKSQYRIVEKS